MRVDIILASAVAAAGFILALWRMMVDSKKMGKSLNEYLHYRFIEEKNGWILLTVIVINAAEAILSATLHPDHGPQLNIVSRFFMHIAISGVAIILMVNLPTVVLGALKVTPYLWEYKNMTGTGVRAQKVNNFFLVSIQWVVVIVYATAALALPYFNLDVIATGFGESPYAQAAFGNLMKTLTFGVFGAPLQLSVDGVVGRPIFFMSMAMKSSWYLVLSHYTLTFLDGSTALNDYLHSIRDEYRGFVKKKKEETKKKHKDSDAYKDTDEEEAEEMANDDKAVLAKVNSVLSKIYNATSTDSVVKRQSKVLMDAFTSFSEEDRIRVALKLSIEENTWKAFAKNTRGLTSDKKKEEYDTLVKSSMEWFAMSPSEGGFGKTIQTPAGK